MQDTVLKYIDILILTETKLDETILISQFLVDGFSKPYRFDKNKHGGEVMAYIWNTISSKILEKHSCPNVCGTYHPHLKMMNIILIILINPLTFTATKIKLNKLS